MTIHYEHGTLRLVQVWDVSGDTPEEQERARAYMEGHGYRRGLWTVNVDGSWSAAYVRSQQVASQDDGDAVQVEKWEVTR